MKNRIAVLITLVLFSLLALAACGNGETPATVDEYADWCAAGIQQPTESPRSVQEMADHFYSIEPPSVLKDFHTAMLRGVQATLKMAEPEATFQEVQAADDEVYLALLEMEHAWWDLPEWVRPVLEAGGCRVEESP